MTERLNVIYLPHQKPGMEIPWSWDVVNIVGAKHNLKVIDYDQPIAPQFKDVDVVIDMGGAMGTREMLAAATKTRLWQILGTGIDHFDVDYWRSQGMPVANCPGPFSAVALAECAMMFILMLTRRYNETQVNLQNGVQNQPAGMELIGMKLAMIGFGASAIELAKRAKPFGLRMSAIDIRDVSDAEKQEYGLDFAGKPEDTDKVIADADFVSLHLHLNKSTEKTIDARRLALMKPSAFLINVARGALVDEPALVDALVNGKLAGAGSGCVWIRAAGFQFTDFSFAQCDYNPAYCRAQPMVRCVSENRLRRRIVTVSPQDWSRYIVLTRPNLNVCVGGLRDDGGLAFGSIVRNEAGTNSIPLVDDVWMQLQNLQEQHGYTKYTTHRWTKRWNDPKVDVVILANPSEQHAETALVALEHSKHTLVEIPIALNLADAERIVATA